MEQGLGVEELGLSVCLFVPSHAGGSGSSSTPWIATGKTGKEGETCTRVQGRVLAGKVHLSLETPASGCLGSLGFQCSFLRNLNPSPKLPWLIFTELKKKKA